MNSSIANRGKNIYIYEKWQKVDLPGPAHQREDPPPQPTPKPLQPQPGQQVPLHMNWSHFKPEYSGKPEEDVEAHLLRMNDWMNTHDFPEDVKVQRFCLTCMGEARSWYAFIRTYSDDHGRNCRISVGDNIQC